MTGKTQTILFYHGGAVNSTALAVLLRRLLDPWLGEHLPLVTPHGAGSHDGAPFCAIPFSKVAATDVACTSYQ